MAHWAQIDDSNIVLQVTVGSNEEPDEGYQWLIDNIGGRWVKTSYNSLGGIHYFINEQGQRVPSGKPHLRYNYAGVGYLYDPIRDAFIPPKPTKGEWVLNESTCLWELVK